MSKYRLYDADGNDIGKMRLGDVPWAAWRHDLPRPR
jgi:hypothetical protein